MCNTNNFTYLHVMILNVVHENFYMYIYALGNFDRKQKSKQLCCCDIPVSSHRTVHQCSWVKNRLVQFGDFYF